MTGRFPRASTFADATGVRRRRVAGFRRQSLAVLVVCFPYDTDNDIFGLPGSRSLLIPLHFLVIRIVDLQPSKREP